MIATNTFPKLRSVEALDDYTIRFEYEDGTVGEKDFRRELDFEGMKALKDISLFKQVHITEFGAIGWNDEIDVCPDALYLEVKGLTS
jgi:hypothetical protein